MPHEPEDQEAYERNSTHAIARAVAAERERCAKIAEKPFHADGKEIAAAIRNNNYPVG